MSEYFLPDRGGSAGGTGASAWYGAAQQSDPAPLPVQPGPYRDPAGADADRRRRKHRRMKAVSLVSCGLILALAVALVVLDGTGLLRQFSMRIGSSARSPFNAEGYVDDLPYDGREAWDGSGGEYDDFREYFDNYYSGSDEISIPAAATGTGVTLPLARLTGEELSLQAIYERVSPAVVGITTYLDGEEYSWGTGVVFTADGYVITNTHVLQGCTQAEVVFSDEEKYDAMLVGADVASDIAVLHVDGKDLPYAEFGRSDELHVGDKAVAIGNPLGQEYAGTMTDGIISAIDRNITYDGHTMTLLQTNAALNEGNSGGPLINAGGQVIGITNMKIMSSYYTTVEGIGFAIPSSVVKQIADQLIETGYVPGEPTIGIVAGSVGQEAMALYGLPDGIYVSQVQEGSDAERKDLRVGDVITAVNGQDVSSVADVNAIKEELEVGDTITVSVWRDGKTLELEIELVDKGEIG